MRDEIIKLCVDVLAHSELDWEINIGGNGYNAFECSGLAREILSILKAEVDVSTRVQELEAE